MQGKAVAATLSKYLSSLVMTILAPLQWMRVLKVADQHHALDGNARKKVMGGIAVGILLAGAATFMVVDFQNDATTGIYETMDGRLSSALGNEAYKAELANQEAARALIATADEKIAEAQAAGDAEAEQTWRDNRAEYINTLNAAIVAGNALVPNAELYSDVHDVLLTQDDEQAMQLIAAAGDLKGLNHAGADNAFERKDAAVQQMGQTLAWFVYPGLIGILWAPVAFATGNVLKTTHVPSDTVGFKPYPAKASGLFLLLGAFGVPALFFAAWVMQDFADRTEIGQISL